MRGLHPPGTASSPRPRNMQAPTFPNFFLVGAQKAGTTAVSRFLDQHPDVFVSPVKEPRYFALADESRDFTGPDDPADRFDCTREEDYVQLFSGADGEEAVGEASTLYLYHRAAAENIRRRVPHARLIAILRQPVDRAYSNFLHCRRLGQEPHEDFLDALKAEGSRTRRGWGPHWHYQRKGRYSGQLARYFGRFPREQILVVTYDELRREPIGLLQRIYRFLEVDDGFLPDTEERWNRGGIPYSVRLQRALRLPGPLTSLVGRLLPESAKRKIKHAIHTANLRPPPELPGAVRSALTRHLYSDEIVAVEAMTGLSVTEEWLPDEEIGSEVESAVREVPLLHLADTGDRAEALHEHGTP